MEKTLEQRIEELEKKVKELQGNIVAKIKKELSIGDTFNLAGYEWKILDITDVGYLCLCESIGDKQFDNCCNDYTHSNIRNYLNSDFLEKISEEIGEDNILSFERDLLSLDGQTEYGKCDDKVSLLTEDEYRKYRMIIPNTDDFWWLCTPWSTKCNGYETSVTVVCPSGYIDCRNFRNDRGVRPVCIFASAIFESEA